MNVFQMPIGRYAPGIVNVVIEVPKGSRKRYRYHRKRRAFVVDYRLMISSPGEYGWVPQTWTPGGKRLNALVLVRKPTWAGNVCEARPIGAIRRADGDHQLVCALLGEPRFETIRDIGNLDAVTLRRLVQFFEPFFPLHGWMNRDEAVALLHEAADNYRSRSHGLDAHRRGEDLPTEVADDDDAASPQHFQEDLEDEGLEDEELGDEASDDESDDDEAADIDADDDEDSERAQADPQGEDAEVNDPVGTSQEVMVATEPEEHDA